MDNKFKPETLCVQAGWQPKKGEPRVLPIYQSTTFKYETSEQMAKLFDLEERQGHKYLNMQKQVRLSMTSSARWLRERLLPVKPCQQSCKELELISYICSRIIRKNLLQRLSGLSMSRKQQ